MTRVITKEMTLRDIKKVPALKPIAPYFISGGGLLGQATDFMRLSHFEKMNWNVESIVDGLNYLIEKEHEGQHLLPIYSGEECRIDCSKKDVQILPFPVENSDKPYVIICAGGAYRYVCSLSEAYPVAKNLNAHGYPVFVLNYRIGGTELMPKPLDDLAASLHYIRSHATEFHVDPDRYIVCGFSAGGNLAALWGTDNRGFQAYDLPAPHALFLVYPAVSPQIWRKDMNKAIAAFEKTMFGKNPADTLVQEYDVLEHVGPDYPPSYIVCCQDDTALSPDHSRELHQALEKHDVPSAMEIGEHGGHGFGEGRGTDTEGWVTRAVTFSEGLTGGKQ